MAGKGILNAVEDSLDWAVSGVKKATKGIISNGDVAGQPGLFRQGIDRLSMRKSAMMNADDVAKRIDGDILTHRTGIDDALDLSDGDVEMAKELAGEHYKAIDDLNKVKEGMDGSILGSSAARYDNQGGTLQTLKNYYSGADVDTYKRTTAAARIGATAAGLHVGGTLLRLPAGGNAQYNSRGERDIAGIPFI